MTQLVHSNIHSKYINSDTIINSLKPQCDKCFGLCCVALYFSEYDGFPTNKDAGTPCPNLQVDFQCKVHDKLNTLGFKGCIGYECLGAGQQVSQVTFEGRSWRQDPTLREPMYNAFLTMRQLHEMCWYLTEALSFRLDSTLREGLEEALMQTEHVTRLKEQDLRQFNISEHGTKINSLLGKASNGERILLRKEGNIPSPSGSAKRIPDYFGKDLRKKDLRCADLKGACLIAANLESVDCTGTDFLGADFRDTNVKGADLAKGIYLTQAQINVALGNSKTKLPQRLIKPKHWIK